jgi:hypothetical protein
MATMTRTALVVVLVVSLVLASAEAAGAKLQRHAGA